jgi:hypothetical protein
VVVTIPDLAVSVCLSGMKMELDRSDRHRGRRRDGRAPPKPLGLQPPRCRGDAHDPRLEGELELGGFVIGCR